MTRTDGPDALVRNAATSTKTTSKYEGTFLCAKNFHGHCVKIRIMEMRIHVFLKLYDV